MMNLKHHTGVIMQTAVQTKVKLDLTAKIAVLRQAHSNVFSSAVIA